MDTPRLETSPTSIVPGWEFATEVVQQACDQGQNIAKVMAEWNDECSRFVSHRANRTREAIAQISKTTSLPELFAIQAKCAQDTVEDYAKEIGRLVEMNRNMFGSLLPLVGQTVRSSAKPPTNAQR